MFVGGTHFIHSYIGAKFPDATWRDHNVQESDFAVGQEIAVDADQNVKTDNGKPDGNPIYYYLRDIFVEARHPPAPLEPSTTFSVNDIVEVTADGYCIHDVANYWECPSSPKTKKGVQGNVLERPMIYNGLWYWHVELESGADGWVAEEFLEKVGAGTPTDRVS